MNINDPTSGRILRHGQGTGTISRADIQRRARELAAIDGRSGANFNAADLARARAELSGRTLPGTTGDDVEGTVGLTRDPSEPPSDTGHAATERDGPDPEKSVERLALEGIEEAQHDQMLAARRREHREDEQERKAP